MKRILSFILCVLMLVSMVPMVIIADDAKSFDDVKPGKWYYDGVMWCYENGYMEGESETIFAPSKEMTRAMLVTVLAAIAGVDTSTYTGSPFTDVGEGKWYTGAIVWANENDIANGISDDTFGYKNAVTREQLVVMVYGFMKYMKVDVRDVRETAFARFGDKDTVHSWAVEAMKWAVTHEIISGTGTVNGAPQLSPRSTATRAQVAVIVKAMLNKNLGGATPVGQLILGDTDVSEFVIVYGETAYEYKGRGRSEEQKKERAIKAAKSIADELAVYIEKATGVALTVYADTEHPAVEGAYEILVGKTNREDGFVTIDRDGLEGDALLYEMKGNYLIIASNELFGGTYMARNRFLEEVVGLNYYDEDIQSYESIKTALIEDGTRVTDAPHMEYFCNYQYHGDDLMVANSETSLVFGNSVHSIPGLACAGGNGCDGFTLDHDHHTKHHMEEDPCLSDSETIKTIVKNVKAVIEDNPDEYLIWVSQSDNSYYCKCKDCAAIYRTFGRGATYVQLLQYVGEAIKDEYPEYKVVGLAYMHTMRAPNVSVSDEDYAEFVASYTEEELVPKQDITCSDNVVVCVCTDTACASHAIDDPNCANVSNSNIKFNEYMERWSQIVPNLYLWDYVDGSGSVPYPNILEFYNNYNYFYNHGVNGLFAQASTNNYPDFAKLRTFLIAKIAWDTDMTKAEFDAYLDGFLEAAYGDGWTYIREYIEALEKLSSENEWHIWKKYDWNDVLTEEQWEENIDYLLSLWEKALELSDDTATTENINYAMTAIRNVAQKMGL